MAEPYSKNILVVDDDTIFHFLMKKALPRLGVHTDSIQSALNGKEALNLIALKAKISVPLPDIILLDLNMPVMGGFQFLEEFNKLELQQDITKVIVISSSLDPRDEARAETLGVNRFLSKPVSDKDLEAILNQA